MKKKMGENAGEPLRFFYLPTFMSKLLHDVFYI